MIQHAVSLSKDLSDYSGVTWYAQRFYDLIQPNNTLLCIVTVATLPYNCSAIDIQNLLAIPVNMLQRRIYIYYYIELVTLTEQEVHLQQAQLDSMGKLKFDWCRTILINMSSNLLLQLNILKLKLLQRMINKKLDQNRLRLSEDCINKLSQLAYTF